MWVDAEDFAITRIEGKPAKNPSFWVRSSTFVHTYEKFGSFWLAVSNVSQSDALVFGHTSIEIHYSDYEINGSSSCNQPLQILPADSAPEKLIARGTLPMGFEADVPAIAVLR